MKEPQAASDRGLPRRQLSLLDSTSIIVGIIIGSAIYEIAPLVAGSAGGWTAKVVAAWSDSAQPSVDLAGLQTAASLAAIFAVWLLGGVIALLGAMCYAELATAYPRAGGTYVYLSEGLGRSVGFAFAWAEFWIVRPGNIGAIAFVLARYGRTMFAPEMENPTWVETAIAAHAILIVALLNTLGVNAGKWTQNLLTAAKLVGLGAIVLTALTLTPAANTLPPPSPLAASPLLALILIMFAYGGWADMSFVAAEVRDPERNISRALLLGTLTVTAIYLAVNGAFVWVLGLTGLTGSEAVAAKVLSLRFGAAGSTAISLLVVVSCLGAINGMLFTGARVYYALGSEHPVFRWLGKWDAARGTPVRSLALQTAVTLALVIVFGLYPGGFERLVVFTGPFYWGFIALVGIALIGLRSSSHKQLPIYRVPLYPLTPLLFVLSSGAMVYAALDYAIRYAVNQQAWEGIWAVIVVLAGVVVGVLDHRRRPVASIGEREA